jgi:hypothetical protein
MTASDVGRDATQYVSLRMATLSERVWMKVRLSSERRWCVPRKEGNGRLVDGCYGETSACSTSEAARQVTQKTAGCFVETVVDHEETESRSTAKGR